MFPPPPRCLKNGNDISLCGLCQERIVLQSGTEGQDSEMRRMVWALCALLSSAAVAATPTITGVTAQQRYPWNGKVDISYTVTGDIAAAMKEYGLLAPVIKVMSIDTMGCVTNTATHLSGDMSLAEGTHTIVWDMDAEGLGFKSSNTLFKVSCETTPALYCVIDLSAGATAASYPVTYLSAPPSGGFNVDTYKTTKLVLRRIEPGSFKMGGSYNVTLTKPFFIGVFEMTDKQYTLINGSRPPQSSYIDKEPADCVTYNMIRGSSNGARWPSSSSVDSSSLIGKIRTRTGLAFDLPTETQWEYACRAGTTSKYNNGGNSADDLKKLGRYYSGSGPSGSPGLVGSYQSNAWGLYDMHGNVQEWCLDWYGSLSSNVVDPKGVSSGSSRVARGGSAQNTADCCASSYRRSLSPGYSFNSENGYIGLRLARTLSN